MDQLIYIKFFLLFIFQTVILEDPTKAKSIFDFTVKDTYGNEVPLEKYRGNVVLIVNIASHCGLTKVNYEQLTELKKKYHAEGQLDF